MLREPSRHDELPNNQAAKDRQRERQRQERAQMSVSDGTRVTPNISNLFNAPVKVIPSVEDPTGIEIRKTFGSYESARPFLTEQNGVLQRRLIGVDQTLNAAAVAASGCGTSSGSVQTQNSSADSQPRAHASASGVRSGIGHKPSRSGSGGILPLRPPQPTVTNPSTSKSDSLNLFKHIPPPPGSHSAASLKLPVVNSQPHVPPVPPLHAIGQVSTLNHIQNSINNAWIIPTPLSPFPVRKQTKLSTTTLPITIVTSSSLNTLSTATSEIGDLPKQLSKTNHNSQSITTTNSIKPLATSSSSSGIPLKSELKSVANHSASVGAPTTEESHTQITFKKPLELSDSRAELDNIIGEMTDVRSPLAAILPPKDSLPKKVATRRFSKSDERTIESLEGIHELKTRLSPLSTTGRNSSSSSSGGDSSDPDSDTDSNSGSEMTTPSNAPIKNATTTTPATTPSPTKRESWGLSSFVGGIRKDSALIEAASTSLEPKDANTYVQNVLLSSESSKSAQKPEPTVSSSTTGSGKLPTNANSRILDTSKALNKPPGFIKHSVPQTRLSSKGAGITDSVKIVSENKGKVPPVLLNMIASFQKVRSDLLKHHVDPTPSGSNNEDEEPPVPPPTSKEKPPPPKTRTPAKRPATTTFESQPAKKKPHQNSAKAPPPPPVPPPILPAAEKGGAEREERKSKSLDRNKDDRIGSAFRPTKDKPEEGGKEKESSTTSVTPRESTNSKPKTPPSLNGVSAKDSGRRSNSSTTSGIGTGSSSSYSSTSATKSNGEVMVKSNSENPEAKVGNTSSSSSNSKRSASPGKGAHQEVSGSSSTSAVGTSEDKSDNSKHYSSKKAKKNVCETTAPSPTPKRESGCSKAKSPNLPSPKAKKLPDPPTKTKQTAEDKSESHAPKSSSTPATTPQPTKTIPTSSKSKTSSSKSAAKSMPPPPPPPPSHSSSSHSKEVKSNKEEEKAGQAIKPPSCLLVRIPMNLLPSRIDKIKKAESLNSASTHSSKKSVKPPSSLRVRIPMYLLPRIDKIKKAESLNSASTHSSKKSDGKKQDGRQKVQLSNPSLLGSSVEDVTDTHNVPNKNLQSSRSSYQTTPPSKEYSSTNGSSSRKRSNNLSHSNSSPKKLTLKDTTEIYIEADSAKNSTSTSELVASGLTPYRGGTTPAKTPPDPPDSSLNPTHSSSPTLALPQQTIYHASYYEKVEHQEDFFAFDHTHYWDQAQGLKHRADKEEPGFPQILMYLDASLSYILTGVLMERTAGWSNAYGMYTQTMSFIRQISGRLRLDLRMEDPQKIKLLVLTHRIHAVLSLRLYKFHGPDCVDASRYLTDHFHSKSPPDYVPPHPEIRNPQTALSTPSPHSPGLSPAGAAGPASVGSAPSSIHAPHHQTHQHVVISKHLYQKLSRYCVSSQKLIQAHDNWDVTDSIVNQNNVQEFFISIDRLYGPLTLHSSLLDLIRYVRRGLKTLNQNLLDRP